MRPESRRAKIAKLSKRDKLILISSIVVGIIAFIITLFLPADLEEYKALGYVGIFVANLFTSAPPVSFFPAAVITFLSSRFLDPVTLILVAGFAATLGENVAYFLGDGANVLVEHYKWHAKLKRLFFRAPFIFLVVWIALPNPIQTLGQAFAGSAKYPFWKYLLASTIGNFIWFALVVYAGEAFFNVV